jgi:hypothetical protein
MLLLLLAAVLSIPRIESPPRIDGSLDDWKHRAFHDGVWDIHRVRHASWFDPRTNRLTDHGGEPDPAGDLSARYYMAWDANYLYLGAEIHDNVIDVDDPRHEDKRWYFKDAICWFVEAPRDSRAEKFGQGDNAFCFVLDRKRPVYAAWWRHGDQQRTYVEEPLTPGMADWALRGEGTEWTLEARVDMRRTFAKSDPAWRPPQVGDEYSVEIVHTDPDGGAYGGHLLIYGNGDDDSTWTPMRLVGPASPVERRKE